MTDAPRSPEFLALQTAFAARYDLQRELGAGGMATVYLAEDRKHSRLVAIKVLRADLSAVIGAQRFLQEIKTTAALQHPHILGLLDSGETEDRLWYVMPFVDGESLRDRISRERQLPIGDAVRVASEVASALDYAHRHGVIHRDIKPENILLHDGRALVADFGIALATGLADSRMTGTGMSLGTPAYMSPEQAMGERAITGRSDVYALGCVLYEMLSGEPPFTGPTAQAIVAKVMTSEPDPLVARRPRIPPNVSAAVFQALEKLPSDRFTHAADFAAALGNPAFAGTQSVSAGGPQSWTRASRLPWILLLATVGAFAIYRLKPERALPPPPVQRFDILLSENAAWVDESGSGMALSPDGSVLAYTGQDSSAQRWVFMRRMDQSLPVRIPGSESGGNPFFSPDGRWVGFIQRGIVRAPIAGGVPQRICGVPGYVNVTMLENHAVVFADGTALGLRQCSATGEVSTLLAGDSLESFNSPYGLPGDRALLFSIRRNSIDRLAVFDLRTRSVNSLDVVGTDPRYVETGHLVYVGPDGRVRAVAFDLRKLAVTGEPMVIADGIRIVSGGRAMMAVSRTGTIVAADSAVSQRALVLVDRAGVARQIYPRLGEFLDPRFSPDGRRIAVSLGTNVWSLDPAGGAMTRLTFDSSASRPVWSHDGRYVAYVRQVGAQVDLRRTSADGSAPAESLLSVTGFSLWQGLFTPDGRFMVVRTTGGLNSRDLWLVPLEAKARALVPLLGSPADEVSASVSPDSHWLAYSSNESGRYEVYVRSFPDMGARYAVSLDGGTVPVWSPRGDELFYRNGPALLAAAVRRGNSFEVLRRSVLFSDAAYVSDPTHQGYDVSPDGMHFVMVRNLGGSSHLTVLLHQLENLRPGGTGPLPAVRPR